MRETKDEEALELPDREAMTLLSTMPVPALPGSEQGVPDPASAGGGAQDTAMDHTNDAAGMADADSSGTQQGSTTDVDRSDTFTSSDSASAES